MVDPTPITPQLPKMSELQRARYDLLQSQMQTLNAQAQAAALQQSNCQLLAGDLQRNMDALMAEVRADLTVEAGTEEDQSAA